MNHGPGRSGNLSELLASPALATLILFFLLFPEERLPFRALQGRLGLGSRSLQRELQRLAGLGLIEKREIGSRSPIMPNRDSGVWADLWRLARRIAAPEEVLRVALSGLPRLEGAFVYGSMARGDERGDSDVDVLLVGEIANRVELARRTMESGALLGREVNVVVYDRETLLAKLRSGSGFLKRVVASEKRWIQGSPAVCLPAA